MNLSRRAFFLGSIAAAGVGSRLGAAEPPRQPAAGAMPPPGELGYLTLTELGALIRARKLSPIELTKAVLDRIDRVDAQVHAFTTVARDEAIASARAAEQEIAAGRYRGPLHGIPFGVKDNHYTRGIPTTVNSPVMAGFVPELDSTAVVRLKQAGAVLVGKLNLPEFSFGGTSNTAAFPATRNPWDLSRTPGGSSSGSGAALAAGLVVLAMGGDTSGSIRNPAALCGVVGMKPTYGRISRHGIVPISWTLDHTGPMTRTVADNARMLNVVAGYDPLDDSSANVPVPDYTRALARGAKGLRVGVPKPDMFEGYHPDVLRVYQEALGLFRTLGARVIEVDMPPTMAVVDDVQSVVRIAEAASYQEGFLRTRPEKYGPTNVRRDVECGTLITAVQYLCAQRVRSQFVREIAALFRTFDLFVTPGMPMPAGEPERVKQSFRRMFNVCGFPALVLPAGFSRTPAGLPIGLQIAARPFEEETIYAAAQAFESATRLYLKRPAL